MATDAEIILRETLVGELREHGDLPFGALVERAERLAAEKDWSPNTAARDTLAALHELEADRLVVFKLEIGRWSLTR